MDLNTIFIGAICFLIFWQIKSSVELSNLYHEIKFKKGWELDKFETERLKRFKEKEYDFVTRDLFNEIINIFSSRIENIESKGKKGR